MVMNMKCWCYECSKVDISKNTHPFFVRARMILCPDCGNKRCPKATDHRLACTNSNEPGQMGSTYGVYPHPSIELINFIDKGCKA